MGHCGYRHKETSCSCEELRSKSNISFFTQMSLHLFPFKSEFAFAVLLVFIILGRKGENLGGKGRKVGYLSNTQLLGEGSRSNNDRPCTSSDSSSVGPKGAFTVLSMPKIKRLPYFTLNTPRDTFQPKTLDPVVIDWTTWQRATNHFTLYEMDAQAAWDYRTMPNSWLRPLCCMHLGPNAGINLLPASFITTGTDPINFKSLSGT